MADLQKFGSVDFAYDYDDNARFRVNLFRRAASSRWRRG
jgi:Tfp pilus assembly pilus retraction ATPase PilT